jgi:hypothetical protein
MDAPTNVSSLRIRIPPIDYSSYEFEYLTPTPGYDDQDQDQDWGEDEVVDEDEVVGGWSYQKVQQVTFNEDDDDDPFQTLVKRFRTPTPHPEPPKHRSFSFYLHTGRINEILPSPPKFPVGHSMLSLVPSHMTPMEYWKTQLDLTDLMPPVDWIQTA